MGRLNANKWQHLVWPLLLQMKSETAAKLSTRFDPSSLSVLLVLVN